MKILTTNFLTCAVKSCRSSATSFPLHFRDAILSRSELDFQPEFILNILPRIDYDALVVTATELGLSALVPERGVFERVVDRHTTSNSNGNGNGNGNDDEDKTADAEVDGNGNGDDEEEQKILKNLHTLFMETEVSEGKLVCANCEFEYPIKEGVANFLLPAHLV